MENKKYPLIVVAASVLALALSFVLSKLDLMTMGIFVTLLFVALFFVLIVRRPLLGLLTVAFLLPFERIGSIDLSGLTIRPSQIVALVMIVAFVWEKLIAGKFSFKKNPIVIPVIAFLISNLFSLFNAINLTRGIMVWGFTLFVVLVSFVVTQMVVTKEIAQKVVNVLTISAIVVSVFGVYQFVGDLIGLPPELTGLGVLYTKDVFGFPRIQSTASEPLYFANYLLIPLGVTISLLLASKSKRTFWWVAVVMLLGINFVLTLSRGGYLGLAALLFVLVIAHYKQIFSKKNLAAYAAVLLVAVIAVGFLLGLSDNAREAFNTFKGQAFNFSSGASIEERQGTITDALKAWEGNPYLGIGPGNFGPFVAVQPLKTPERGWLIVNNETVELLAETGVIGLGLFIVVLIVVTVRSVHAIFKARDPYVKSLLIGVFAAFVGIFVQYQTFSTLFILHVWFAIGLLIALQNLALGETQKRGEMSSSGMVAPK